MPKPLHIKGIAPKPDRATILIIAAKVECDPRTARRILVDGVKTIRAEALRERATRVLAELGIAA